MKRGYDIGRNSFKSNAQNKNTTSDETKNESENMKEGGYFSVRVMRNNGHPAIDVGVMVVYSGLLTGPIGEERTNSDGWVEFHNRYNEAGTIWVHGHNMGEHSLSDGKTYSFTI